MSVGTPDDNAILNAVSDGISVNTGDSFVFVNKTLASMLGYTVEELIGQSVADVVIPADADKVVNYGLARQKGLDVPSTYEITMLRKDGTTIPAELSVSRVMFRGKSSSLTIARDISSRLESEAKVRETEKRYQILFNDTGEAILVHSGGKFVEANDAAERLLGYTLEELKSKGPVDISYNNDPDRFKEVVETIKKTGRRVRRGNLVRKDGSIIDVFITSQQIVYAGGKAILSVVLDVSERVEYERNLHVLHSHASKLGTAEDIQSIYVLTCEAIQEIIKSDRVALGIVYPDKIVYEYFTDITTEPLTIPLESKSISTRVINTGVSEMVNDVSVDPDFFNPFPVVTKSTKSELIVPVKVGKDIVALINLGNNSTVQFTENDRKLVETLSEHVASSINRIRQSALIKESELQLRNFMDSASDGFTILDSDLIVKSSNRTWLDQAGLKKDDVVGKRLEDFMPHVFKTGRVEAYRKVIETGEPAYFPGVEAASHNGLYIDIAAFKSGDYLGIVTRDVTENRAYQQNLEMLHANAASLSSAETFADIVRITQESIAKVLGKDFSTIGLIQGDNLVYDHLWSGHQGPQIVLPLNGPGVSVLAVNEGRSIRVDDLRDNVLYVESSGNIESRSELDVPLFMEGKVVGVINLESNAVGEFSESDQKLVEILASHVSAAMSRIEYVDRLNALHSMTHELGYAQNNEQICECLTTDYEGRTWVPVLINITSRKRCLNHLLQ